MEEAPSSPPTLSSAQASTESIASEASITPPPNAQVAARNNIIRELVETERKYVQDLEVMQVRRSYIRNPHSHIFHRDTRLCFHKATLSIKIQFISFFPISTSCSTFSANFLSDWRVPVNRHGKTSDGVSISPKWQVAPNLAFSLFSPFLLHCSGNNRRMSSLSTNLTAPITPMHPI